MTFNTAWATAHTVDILEFRNKTVWIKLQNQFQHRLSPFRDFVVCVDALPGVCAFMNIIWSHLTCLYVFRVDVISIYIYMLAKANKTEY